MKKYERELLVACLVMLVSAGIIVASIYVLIQPPEEILNRPDTLFSLGFIVVAFVSFAVLHTNFKD